MAEVACWAFGANGEKNVMKAVPVGPINVGTAQSVSTNLPPVHVLVQMGHAKLSIPARKVQGGRKKRFARVKQDIRKALIRGNACMQAVWRVVLPVHTEDRNITVINANAVLRPAVCIITAYVSS